jgi:3-deoxy-D-manno-octulosonic-acid transferase
VLVGDTMGELQRLYAAADVAFIGGSLVPHGGQNLLEACAVEVPVVFGPHMFHFEEISAMALERGAARQVHDVRSLAEAVALYLDQPDLRRAAGRAAHTLVADNRGALGRTLDLVDDALRGAVASAGETARDASTQLAAEVGARSRE